MLSKHTHTYGSWSYTTRKLESPTGYPKTYIYEWWIKKYPGVPYGKHPAAGGVDPSNEEMYGERPTDGTNGWVVMKKYGNHSTLI